MIQIKDLNYSYGNEKVLDNINLNIPKRTTCAIIGPSGCGKTTLLYIMAGLLPFSRGQVVIDNSPLMSVRKKTGIILQNKGLLPWKTVWDNIALGMLARKLDRKTIEERITSTLKELSIWEHKDKFPSQLSGGQMQRVAIARTLVTDPDILLLDEATSALDAITQEKIQNLILELYKRNSITLLLVTHSIEEAVFLGQNIVVMERGSIKRIIENPYFGDSEIRSKQEYYQICNEVRESLYEDGER
jgi:NitT/TauT family transport system ATP-binding protein